MLQMGEQQLQNFKKAFDLFDKDGNGMINKEQIVMAFHQLNIKLSDDEINNIFKQFDENRNNTIQFDQFVDILRNNMDRENSQAWLSQAFAIMDQDCDGRLSKLELSKVVKLYGLGISQKELNQILEAFDDHQGKGISYQSFSSLLKF